MKIVIILGTRPEIIKMSPIIQEYQKRHLNFFILHTNQYYLENLDEVFFKELNLPKPRYNLSVGSGSHGEQTWKMLMRTERVLIKEKPDIVLAEGDTNTVLAGALTASKLSIKIDHVEAGLRSYFRAMPKEINMILTDHLSDFLFTSITKDKNILIKEGIPRKKIFITGNTIVDAIYQNIKISKKKSKIIQNLILKKGEHFLLILHRRENVDVKDRLTEILAGLELVYKGFKLLIIFQIYPRTQKRIREFKLKIAHEVNLIKSFAYLDFLGLEFEDKMILIYSGGVQEEACILKIICVTLRDNTKRFETLEIKKNILVGVNLIKILSCVKRMINKKIISVNLFGDKKVAKNIIGILIKNVFLVR